MKCHYCDQPAAATCDAVLTTAHEKRTEGGDFPRCRRPVCRAHARISGAPGVFDPGAWINPNQPYTTCPAHTPEGAA